MKKNCAESKLLKFGNRENRNVRDWNVAKVECRYQQLFRLSSLARHRGNGQGDPMSL
jgi:hypothetical protein